MNTLAIVKPSQELLKQIKRYFPSSYRYDDWETIYLEAHIIMEDPFRNIFTLILHDTFSKVQLTINPDECQRAFVTKKRR